MANARTMRLQAAERKQQDAAKNLSHRYSVVIVRLNGMVISGEVDGFWKDAVARAEEMLNDTFYFDAHGYKTEGDPRANPFRVIVAMSDGRTTETASCYEVGWDNGRRMLMSGRR